MKKYIQVSRGDYKVLRRQFRVFLKYTEMEKRIGDGDNTMTHIAMQNFLDYCAFAGIDYFSILWEIIDTCMDRIN